LLPSLLVRQSALVSLELESTGALAALYRERVEGLPDQHELQALIAAADRYRLPPELTDQPVICPWVRVALPLRRDGRLLGVWLLGRRDPDDYYSRSEIAGLRTLADQTAIALAHLLQTERLRQLLQANVDRDEQERGQWALNLHDDILNELALLAPGPGQPAETVTAYQRVVARVRQMIGGLRPAMLAYGLHRALEQLADDLADRAGETVQVQMDLVGDTRYPLPVEQHLFRIIQQASENALKHAQARTLRLEASLQPEQVELRVEDDGLGLPPGVQDDLAGLIAKRHFGLAGMFERAAFIGADLRLASTPGCGTTVQAIWRRPAQDAPG
jgi:nitrate/nitrite-specific signal transduction histidine kinase